MVRRFFALTTGLVVLALLGAAAAQEDQNKQVKLHVLLPEDETQLFIDGKLTKQTGTDRLYFSPPLAPGRNYTYTLMAKFEPNNYTKITRTRKVTVKPGEELQVDMRKADPAFPDKLLIRYVPTADEVVKAMCKLAKVGKDDVVFDLGCGDGRIVITAIKDFGAKRGFGLDIDPERIKDSLANAKEAGLTDKIKFRQGDVLKLKDLGEATVVMLYMGEHVNLRLMPLLKSSLKPGSRIVSHDFKMGDWRPDRTIQVTDSEGDKHDLYLWKIRPKKEVAP